jgi:hypothetical protein
MLAFAAKQSRGQKGHFSNLGKSWGRPLQSSGRRSINLHSGDLHSGADARFKRDFNAPAHRHLQAKAAQSGVAENGIPPIVDEVVSSSGQPLDSSTRGFMESRIGHDFSQVRVHSDDRAAASARAIHANAYTVGSNVVFGPGRFQPSSRQGQHLLAHELTHVVQQRAGVHLSNGIGQPGDVYERQADQVADSLSRDRPSAVFPAADVGGVKGKGTSLQMDPEKKDATPAGVNAAAKPAPATPDKPAKLHLFTQIDVKSLGLGDVLKGDVGHTWVSLEYPDPKRVPETLPSPHKDFLKLGGKYADPMGFWPAINEGIGYSANPFSSYVKGWMRHPDRAHEGGENATQTWNITQPAVEKVIQYAESKRSSKYSVYFYNCTDFAKEAVEAAGMKPPKMSTFGICLPNAVYDGIKARQQKGIGNTSVKELGADKATEVSGPDEASKKKKKSNG